MQYPYVLDKACRWMRTNVVQNTQALGSAYLATLHDTAAILQAFQKAHLTSMGLLNQQAAAQEPADPVSDVYKPQEAAVLSLSPDSLWCAVTVDSCFTTVGPEHSRLLLYETHTGRLVRQLHRGDVGRYRASWSPCSRYLTVLMGLEEYRGRQVIVYDIAAGSSTVPAWSPAAAEVLQGDWYDLISEDDHTSSADIRLMLCMRCQEGLSSLHVLSIEAGNVVASSDLVRSPCSGDHKGSCGSNMPLWHPSAGFIMPDCTWILLSPDNFRRAGLAVGFCALPAHLGPGSAFSPSGSHLLASYAEAGEMVILSCTAAQQTYTLTIEYMLEGLAPRGFAGRWLPIMPHKEDRLLLDDGLGIKMVSPRGEPLGKTSSADLRLALPLCDTVLPQDTMFQISPCGKFSLVLRGEGGAARPCILHCPSGRALDLVLPAPLTVEQVFWPASGACLLLSDGTFVDQARKEHATVIPFTVLCFPSD